VSLSDDAARRIRAARQRLGWSQRELAKRSGLSEDVIDAIENGRRRRGITVDELFAFADALKVQVGALLPDMQAADLRHDALSEAIAALERLRDDR
jgi:transcriptional regulator with XRE-family HTH domain